MRENEFPLGPTAPESGQHVGYVGVSVDRRNDVLAAEVARLREALTARDAFLAVAAHELRNPMTPIIGRLQRLRRAASKPDFRAALFIQDLDQIEWLIMHYLKRATTLLEVSRITSGKLALTQLPVDISSVVRGIEENFRPLAQHSGSDLTLDLPEKDLVVCGDQVAIEEILENLVSNAIKYGANKPIAVSVEADEERGVGLVRVSDGGPGISVENRARIFERFERAVRPDDQSGGFGVGLWIVQQLTKAMNGAVMVDSKPGEGSTFCVTLPLSSSKASE